jgi:fumarylacetoacetase
VTDHTHDAKIQSWVADANGHPDFPLQNLPFGIFNPPGGRLRAGVAIGTHIVDLAAARGAGLILGKAADAVTGPTLNPLFALGPAPRAQLRARLFALLAADAPQDHRDRLVLHRAAACTMQLPAAIGDYTDFFAGIHHATNAGKLFRPDTPLLPNYKYVPVAYHGRASSIRPSPTPVTRPNGQRKPASETTPSFGPSRNLDYELELGIWVGLGNPPGSQIPIAEAHDHIAGYCLLNDWSARDIQGWEAQPLGPFLAKSFQTSISPWVVTPEALRPFRSPQPRRPAGDPDPLPHLSDRFDQAQGALNLDLEVHLLTKEARRRGLPPHRLSAANARELYWTPAQMLAHHASNGCNLNPGDLLGSGTISGTTRDSCGALLEITNGGRDPIELPNGEIRRFLEDGDEVILTAHAHREGYVSIGFGECRGVVVAAK